MPSVLFIGSDTGVTMPLEEGDNRIDADLEAGYINMAYRAAAPTIDFECYAQTRVNDFAENVSVHKPDVLHIACHGSKVGLWFKGHDSTRNALVRSGDVADMLRYEKDKVVFIDACQSADFAEELFSDKSLRIRLAIGHKGYINSAAAYLGARAFHAQLSRGTTYDEAVQTMRATVAMIDGERRTVSFSDKEFLGTTLAPDPARIIARFANEKDIGPDSDGIFHVEFGAAGFLTRDRCVVSFFSDDANLVGSDFTTVESGFPRNGVFWTHNYNGRKEDSEIWPVERDFTVYLSYLQNGKYNMVKSTLGEALKEYYCSGRYKHTRRIRDSVARALDDMR